MKDQLSRAEITKDAVQHTVEAGAETVAAVSGIVIGAVRDVAHALGGFATEVFEIRDAARRASVEAQDDVTGPAGLDHADRPQPRD